MVRRKTDEGRASVQFWVLSAFLVVTFAFGGGARGDIQSLIFLRPLSVLVCGFAIWRMQPSVLSANKFLLGFAAALFAIALVQLVPLPPGIWAHLPGRGILAEVDRFSGEGAVWRPLTMVPNGTWNAAFSLFVPFAVLLLAIQLGRRDLARLLPVLIVLCIVSGLVGLCQMLDGSHSAFYFYEITNRGSAVGLFANRNHAAVFLACIFPMLALFASEPVRMIDHARVRQGLAIAISLIVVPLILVTGSRAGLIAGAFGLLAVPFLYHAPEIEGQPKRGARRSIAPLVILGAAVLGVAAVTILLARGQAFDRLIAPGQAEDARFGMWGPIAQMAFGYFPFGSGLGSFQQVYQIQEPLGQLRTTYVNHAHNDWLEVYLTAGLCGLLALLAATAAWAIGSFKVWRRTATGGSVTAYGRLGSVVLLILGFASVGDYPLRVPSLACFAVVAAVWLLDGVRSRNGQSPSATKQSRSERSGDSGSMSSQRVSQ